MITSADKIVMSIDENNINTGDIQSIPDRQKNL